ncbi:MAG: HEAT repeat domain-containing protein [Planctomycetes bacterium]|nr:HEAT repeat domain-containing protein [Planctomycetota bacterium]
MRTWLTRLRLSILVVFCVGIVGTLGCTKNPPAPSPDAKVDKDAKTSPIAKAPNTKDPVVKQPDVKQPEQKQDDVKQPVTPDKGIKDPNPPEGTGKDVIAKQLDPPMPTTEFTPKDLPTIAVKDPKKKDKDKDKEPKVAPKESPKDPKAFEFKEPEFVDGKSFKEWMADAKSTDPGKREAFYKHITLFGPTKGLEVMPIIVADLSRHPKVISVDLSVRVNGIMAISTIYKMLPMIKKTPDPDLHKKVVALYKQFLNDPQVIMKIRTMQGLPLIGYAALDNIEDVIKLTEERITWEVRKEAMECLFWLAMPDGKGSGPNEIALKAFRKPLLRSKIDNAPLETSYYVRQTAVEKLTILNQLVKRFPPELRSKAVLEDPSIHVRLTVLRAIMNFEKDIEDKERPLAVKALNGHLLWEKDDILKIWTHATIMTLTDINKAHMDPITKLLRESKQITVKMQALTVIASGGVKSKKFALDDVLAITKIDPVKEKEMAPLIGSAWVALVNMHHFDPILEKLKDKEPPIRIQALELIQMAGTTSKPFCLKPVVDMIHDKDTDVAEAAIVTLEYMNAFEAIPDLESLAKNAATPVTVKEAADDAAKGLRQRQLDGKKKEKDKN